MKKKNDTESAIWFHHIPKRM